MVSDISNVFTVASVDSHYALKKYFFLLSPRDETGVSWCSIILAQSIPFQAFMEKAQSALANQDFSIWPKPLDNENASDVGWLLYSTRAQDEERLTQPFSTAIEENIGGKWKPIWTMAGGIGKKEADNPNERIYALHIKCTTDRIHEVRKKLGKWYNSQSSKFLDGTKMARQAAVAAGLATASTWEMSTNLLLDKKDPSTGKSFHDIMMA
jgi:hypothetical protein